MQDYKWCQYWCQNITNKTHSHWLEEWRWNQYTDKVISKNQFCVPGRTIIECNNNIRDTVYYLDQKNITGAIVNLDWEKAFDRVNWSFLSRALHKMGFPVLIINWFFTLYLWQILLKRWFPEKIFPFTPSYRLGKVTCSVRLLALTYS